MKKNESIWIGRGFTLFFVLSVIAYLNLFTYQSNTTEIFNRYSIKYIIIILLFTIILTCEIWVFFKILYTSENDECNNRVVDWIKIMINICDPIYYWIFCMMPWLLILAVLATFTLPSNLIILTFMIINGWTFIIFSLRYRSKIKMVKSGIALTIIGISIVFFIELNIVISSTLLVNAFFIIVGISILLIPVTFGKTIQVNLLTGIISLLIGLAILESLLQLSNMYERIVGERYIGLQKKFHSPYSGVC